jgi:hypothetical protein
MLGAYGQYLRASNADKQIHLQSSSDLPLLVNIRNLAIRLLQNLSTSASPLSSATLSTSTSTTPLSHPSASAGNANTSNFKIGFITPPFRDSKIPVTDHLHAHAYIAPADLMGWFRGIAYTAVAWYAIDDLIAEIRCVPFFFFFLIPGINKFIYLLILFSESVSNNRVKSGYTNRHDAPIDTVPYAGARAGTANGIETTEPGLGTSDLEEADPLTPSGGGSTQPIPSSSAQQSPRSSSSSGAPDRF